MLGTIILALPFPSPEAQGGNERNIVQFQHNVYEDQVLKIIKDLKNSSATGVDYLDYQTYSINCSTCPRLHF